MIQVILFDCGRCGSVSALGCDGADCPVVQAKQRYNDVPDDCPDCGSPGECAPGCPSRLP